ncbi:hypothetical protein NYR77_03515 [Actinobacillus equuli subsp. haemolyticus]|nr:MULTISPECIES: DUF6803 family protein [Pasteurellaceae]VGM95358.1 Uncharacterised protein [uncultured Avibacterium sp.]MDG2943833.1 hypothetical protein [Exercitatus varius]MDG2946976.1 hypothetical protein [Exercitatus varius]MDY5847291.1 DUF6803 family protein [Actinobacillus porcinus]WGE47148.1 hypothetical protein NYR84_02825 [Actinobacillus equuli subsp. haemolyticus]
MIMTHYMELLAASPWNLILFMVIPMIIGELLVATEFFALFYKDNTNNHWKHWNKILSVVLGVYYTIVAAYVGFIIVPTITEWRGWVDIASIASLLLATFPIFIILLMELKVIHKNLVDSAKIKLHAVYLVIFLFVSHFAMIFGMADPISAGYQPTTPAMTHSMQMDAKQMTEMHNQMMTGEITPEEMMKMHQEMNPNMNMPNTQGGHSEHHK